MTGPRIDVDCSESEMLPSPNASLRQATGIAWGNRTWIYADFIPFDSIKYPASYNTTIHAFSSSDGCRGCACDLSADRLSRRCARDIELN